MRIFEAPFSPWLLSIFWYSPALAWIWISKGRQSWLHSYAWPQSKLSLKSRINLMSQESFRLWPFIISIMQLPIRRFLRAMGLHSLFPYERCNCRLRSSIPLIIRSSYWKAPTWSPNHCWKIRWPARTPSLHLKHHTKS